MLSNNHIKSKPGIVPKESLLTYTKERFSESVIVICTGKHQKRKKKKRGMQWGHLTRKIFMMYLVGI